jgi:hypothetical protein
VIVVTVQPNGTLGKIGIIHQGAKMSPLTREQRDNIAKKVEYEAQNERLVKKCKPLDTTLKQIEVREGLA